MPLKQRRVPAGARRPRATGRSRETTAGVFVLVVLTAGAYLPSPLYPGYQQAFGAGDLAMTLTYATFALVSAPTLLLLGPASDALGPVPVLRLSIAAAAVGSLCFAAAAGPGWLIAGRAAQGLALGAATGAAGALIASGGAGAGGRRAAALAGTAFLAGTAAGPVASGLLAAYAPMPRVLPFALHLVLLWAGWRLVSALARTPGARVRRWRPTRPQIPAAVRPHFTAAALSGFLAWAAAGLFLSVIPALLERGGQGSPAVVGGVLGTVLVCSLLARPLVAAVGPWTAQLAGLAAVLLGLVLLAFSAEGPVPLTLAAAVVAGAGHGAAYGGAAAAVEEAVPAERRGAVTGALYLAFYLGAGLPAIAIGLASLAVPLAAATTWTTAAAALLVPAAAAAMVRGARRAAAAPGPAAAARTAPAPGPGPRVRPVPPLRAASRAPGGVRGRRPRPAAARGGTRCRR
ncbi:MFS transporter [Nocardiopsis potens]|uniref:MFS transporter n=1 Tax=Nocardiopsis potens TaxID=1246458 RepID=UPI0012678DD0|nr:MFS transporter [Nocardiopsis potens]